MSAPIDERLLRKIDIDAVIADLMAETARISQRRAESRWYPWVAIAGIYGAALAIVKFVA